METENGDDSMVGKRMQSSATERFVRSERDLLALERTKLANERTLLAYTRTAIMLGATGATLFTLYGDRAFYAAIGWTLLALGIALFLLGGYRFRRLSRMMEKTES
ncbi:MAG: DUF202 domain-containing protein [Lacipirellulaceae bacterium]